MCRAAAEVTWLGLLLVLPSAINPSGALGVEPEKASVLRVAAALIGALWLATRLLAPASGQPVRVSPLLGAALAWLACAGLSTAASIDPVLSLFGSYDREMGLLTLAAGPLLLVVGSDILAERAARERTVAALLLGAVVPCAYALLQQAGRDPLGWSGVVGVVSTFGSPTFLGGYLVLIAPFAAYRLVADGRLVASGAGPGTVGRYALTLAFALLLLAVVFEVAIRGPLLGLAISLVVFAVLVARPRARRSMVLTAVALLAAGLLGVALALLAGLDLAVFQRFAQIASPAGSAAERVGLWRAAMPLPLADPRRVLLGFGPETQSAAFEPSAAIVLLSSTEQFDRAHDLFVDAWLTGGLLGLGALVAVMLLGLRTAWATYRSASREASVLPAALLAALVGHLVEQAFAFPTVVTGAWVWVVLAFVVALAGEDRRRAIRSVVAPRPILAAAVLILTLAVLPALAGPAVADSLHGRALEAEQRGDWRGAAGYAEAAAVWAPSAEELPRVAGIDWQTLGLRARGQEADVLLQRAADDFKEAIRRAPGDPYARARLGRHYAAWARHGSASTPVDELVQRGRTACQEAVAVGPHRPAIASACADVLRS